MPIKVLIVEDEMLVAEEISFDLQDQGFDVTGIAISSDECLAEIQKNQPHVILMDINIKGDLDGIQTAQLIQQKTTIPIVYLTANTDSATLKRAIETSPSAFISKPFSKKDLIVALELAFNKNNEHILTQKSNSINDLFFVKSGKFYTKIDVNEINYLEANGSYTEIVTNDKNYTLSTNLNHFQENIQNPYFVRIHRSFVVNIKKVDGFDNNTILINGKSLPISKSYQKEVFNLFNKL